MRTEVVKRNGSHAVIRIEFGSGEFELAVAEAFCRVNGEDAMRPEYALLSLQAVLSQCDNALEVTREAVRDLASGAYAFALDTLGLVALSDMRIRAVPSEVGEPLVVFAELDAVPPIEELVYEGFELSYCEVCLEGGEVDERLAEARASYGVETDEELLGSIRAYGDVASMRAAMARSLEERVAQLNGEAMKRAAINALLEANPLEVPERDVDEYVEAEIQMMRDQMPPGEFDRRTPDLDALRRAVRRDVGHMPKLNAILATIAHAMKFEITDADRLAAIEGQRAMSIEPDRFEPASQTMEALEADAAARASLDRKIARDKALAHVIRHSTCTPRLELTLREASSSRATRAPMGL